jgi:hypothetical protein
MIDLALHATGVNYFCVRVEFAFRRPDVDLESCTILTHVMQKTRQFSHRRQADLASENTSGVGHLLEVFPNTVRPLLWPKVVGNGLYLHHKSLHFELCA